MEKVAKKAIASRRALPPPLNTVLHDACKSGSLDDIKMLLAAPDADKLLRSFDREGYAPIHYLCLRGDLELLKFFKDSGRSDLLQFKTQDGLSPLEVAVNAVPKRGSEKDQKERLYLEVAAFLLQEGAEVNSRGIGGMTPFTLTCINGCWSLARLLLAHQADINAKDPMNFSPLMHVIDNEDWVAFLLENGAEVNLIGSDGSSPLSMACASDKTSIVELLLEKGAYPNIGLTNKDQELPPLHLACKNKNLEMIKMLVAAGANVNQIQEGRSALGVHMEREPDDAIIEFLLGHGAEASNNSKVKIVGYYPKYERLFTDREERQLFSAKKLAHANHVGNQKEAPLEYEGWQRQIFYHDFAEIVEASTLYEKTEGKVLAKALKTAAELPFNSKAAAAAIRNGELVIIPSGWSGHALSLIFYKGRLMRCNRGEGARDSSVEISKFDIQKIDEALIQEIINTQKLSPDKGETFIYKTLSQKLSCSEDSNTRELGKATASTMQTVGNCTFASVAGALLAALGLLASEGGSLRPETIKEIRQCTRKLTQKQRLVYLEHYLEAHPTGEAEFLAQESWKKMKKHLYKRPEELNAFPQVKSRLFDPEKRPLAERAVAGVKKCASQVKERVQKPLPPCLSLPL